MHADDGKRANACSLCLCLCLYVCVCVWGGGRLATWPEPLRHGTRMLTHGSQRERTMPMPTGQPCACALVTGALCWRLYALRLQLPQTRARALCCSRHLVAS